MKNENPTDNLKEETTPVVEKEPSFSKSEVQDIVNAAVQEAIKNYKLPQELEVIKENQNKLGELIQASHARLVEPNPIVPPESNALETVKTIFKEYEEKKMSDPNGRPFYPNNETGLFKTKIIMMRKIGMSDEEIAEIVKSMV